MTSKSFLSLPEIGDYKFVWIDSVKNLDDRYGIIAKWNLIKC